MIAEGIPLGPTSESDEFGNSSSRRWQGRSRCFYRACSSRHNDTFGYVSVYGQQTTADYSLLVLQARAPISPVGSARCVNAMKDARRRENSDLACSLGRGHTRSLPTSPGIGYRYSGARNKLQTNLSRGRTHSQVFRGHEEEENKRYKMLLTSLPLVSRPQSIHHTRATLPQIFLLRSVF